MDVENFPQLSYATWPTTVVPGTMCGCYHCLRTFDALDVKTTVADRDGRTALCPHCGIDSVVQEPQIGGPITDDLLQMGRDRWFRRFTPYNRTQVDNPATTD